MYRHIEDMIMKFLPSRNERRMSNCYWHKRPGCINSCAALVLKTLLACMDSLISSPGLRNSWMNSLGALSRNLVAWPSCLAGSTQRYSELAFLYKILLT
jgi:hypothetical protein